MVRNKERLAWFSPISFICIILAKPLHFNPYRFVLLCIHFSVFPKLGKFWVLDLIFQCIQRATNFRILILAKNKHDSWFFCLYKSTYPVKWHKENLSENLVKKTHIRKWVCVEWIKRKNKQKSLFLIIGFHETLL